MNIEFRRLLLHNFMSFGDAELLFEDDGFVRVSGINENSADTARSNGSGKSSLWEAIIWSLTGDTIRGTRNVTNMYTTDGTFVELDFNIDSVPYKIVRSKDHAVKKTNLQIVIDGKDCSGKGIRDSEKLLEGYLPDITSSFLGSVIVLGQGLPQRFTSNTPAGRKEVLEKLSKSDFMIEDLKSRVENRKFELMKSSRDVENTLLRLKTTSLELDRQREQAENELNSLRSDEIEAELFNVNTSIQKLSEEQSCVKEKYELISSEINKLDSEKANIESKRYAAVERCNADYYRNTSDVNVKLAEFKGQMQALQRHLNEIRKIQDVCPTCGQQMPDVVKPDTTDIETDITKLSCEIQKLEDLLARFNSERDSTLFNISSDFETRLQTIYQEHQKAYDERLNIHKELQQKETTISNLVAKKNELESKLSRISYTVDILTKNISKYSTEITSLSSEILYNKEQGVLVTTHLEVISKFETALKREFRGYLLSTVIEFIEQRAKHYSLMLFDQDVISFCLNGNNIDINYMNKPYENLSCGEKQKIDLIVQFSIRDMLTKQLGFSSNILVLDEVFDGLDSEGCERVISMISSLSDIKNIFIVTHRHDLSIPTDKELLVAKSSAGISRISS